MLPIMPLQGSIGPAELLEALVSAANEHGAELVAERAEASERVRWRRLWPERAHVLDTSELEVLHVPLIHGPSRRQPPCWINLGCASVLL